MAKLTADQTEEVNEAEESKGEFLPRPAGEYVYKLVEVKDDGEGPKGPYWTWVLEMDTDYHPKFKSGYSTYVFHITSLGQPGMVKAMFNGFGYSPDSDTDEIVEDPDARIVGRTVVNSFKKKGETEPTINNKLKSVKAFDPEKWEKIEEPDDDDWDNTDD